MRKRDKLKNIEQANTVLEQSYLKSKILIIETFNTVLTEEKDLDVNKVAKTIEKAGADPKDKEIQKSFLEELIDNDFNPNSIKVDDVLNKKKKIKQNESFIIESAGVNELAHGIHSALDWIEHSETGIQFLEKLTHISGGLIDKKTVASISKGLHFLEKILNFIPDLLSKGIYKIIRFFGGSLETAKIGSQLGDVIWLTVLAAFTIKFWPGVAAAMTGGLTIIGVGSLLLKLWNAGRTMYKIIKNFITGIHEASDVKFSVIDFLNNLEKFSNEKFKTKFQIEYNTVKSMEKWFGSIKKEQKDQAQISLKQAFDLIKDGKETKAQSLLNRLNIPEDVKKVLHKMINGDK